MNTSPDCRTLPTSVVCLEPLSSLLFAVCHAVVAASLFWCAEEPLAQEVVYHDEEVKAAFIYHFATFVQWPQNSGSHEVFSVAVLGADDVASELEKFLPGRNIQGRRMEVRRLRGLDELHDDAVLFIGASENPRLPELIREVRDRPMLVVTDAPAGLKEGATINFQVVDERVRFEISLTAAERAGLELSSRLLAAAMSVDTTSAVAPPAGIRYASAFPGIIRR